MTASKMNDSRVPCIFLLVIFWLVVTAGPAGLKGEPYKMPLSNHEVRRPWSGNEAAQSASNVAY
jgi:hypothetical protein